MSETTKAEAGEHVLIFRGQAKCLGCILQPSHKEQNTLSLVLALSFYFTFEDTYLSVFNGK